MNNYTSWILRSFIVIILFTSLNLFFALATDIESETLIIRGEIDNEHLDNRKTNSIENSFLEGLSIQFQGFLGMIAPGETVITMPTIAESWTHSEDFTKWTFTIREGAKFHDGTSINAKAVKYSIIANLLVAFGFENLSQSMKFLEETGFIEIEFPDSDPNGMGREVTLSWGSLSIPLFELFISGGAMDAKDLFVLVPFNSHGTYSDNSSICQTKTEAFSKLPVSAGPYKVAEFVVGEHILLERFDDWFGWGQKIVGSDGKEYIFPQEEKAYRYIKYVNKEQNTVNNIIEGELDIYEDWEISKVELQELNTTDGVTTFMDPITDFSFISLNLQGDWPTFYGGLGNFPLSQVWFRQAISHAIDRSQIISEEYLERGFIFDEINPSWILEHFPSLDTSNYYDYNQGVSTAQSILNMNNYRPLGFDEEPENRFGYGNYANETSIDGIERKKGRHFTFLTYDSHEQQAEIIQENLKEIGIYIDIIAQDKSQTRHDVLYDLNWGEEYNLTYYPSPDPDFSGPNWDFFMPYSNTLPCENPWSLIQYCSVANWLIDGWGMNGGWYNPEFEKALAKTTGDIFQDLPFIAENIPGFEAENSSCPEWNNNNTQFVEACESAGEELSRELPFIPLFWYAKSYVTNSMVNNLVINGEGFFHVAYTYQETGKDTNFSIFPIGILALIGLLMIRDKKRRT